MKIELSVNDILDLIETSNNPEFAKAILDNSIGQYQRSFPAIGTIIDIPSECFSAVVVRHDYKRGLVIFNYKETVWHDNPELTGESKYSKRDNYIYPKETGNVYDDSYSLEKFEQRMSKMLFEKRTIINENETNS